MTGNEDASEAERRLGISYVNIASHGVKEHLGKMVSDDVALLLFSRGDNETIAALWDMEDGRAITSRNLPFSLGMLWDWDWRAEAVETAFAELAGTLHVDIVRTPMSAAP